ncbi:MAG: ATP-dependent Clp protease proteolytic subunit [Lachnospiraceae bacterium]|nr:ATP-dependent Clp protease proteolytic subunit [Lachnospiraceae bacterium]
MSENREKVSNGTEGENTEKLEERMKKTDEIDATGQTVLDGNGSEKKIQLLSIIGEIEGHETVSNQKTTKYDHVLPKLAEFEDDKNLHGLLVLLQTCGGDVESGLAIAEMIASLSKPTVSLVFGGSHSIGVPIATSTDSSYIVPSGTMVVHPVRMNGLFIGAPQTYDYFKSIQDRIVKFVSDHSNVTKERLEEMMLETGVFTKDLGTILVGEEAVKEGIIDEVGGLKDAMRKLYDMMK